MLRTVRSKITPLIAFGASLASDLVTEESRHMPLSVVETQGEDVKLLGNRLFVPACRRNHSLFEFANAG